MLSNSSNTPAVGPPNVPQVPSAKKRLLYSIGLPVWVFFGFMLAQALLLAAIYGLEAAGVSLEGVDSTILNTVVSVVVYTLAVMLVLGIPWLIKRRPTTLEDLGLQRLPTWLDIAWAPAGMVVYVIVSAIIMALAAVFLTFVNPMQAQDVGFSQLMSNTQYLLAFVSLVVIAPIAEEVLFRGYLFGKLRKYAPLWVAILVTSVLFGIVHFQWNVGLDVFALSIVLCLLRVVSGSLWPSILLHMLKNGVAFYFLFIDPSLLGTLGG
jgi:membrane protease YdiL (CAAX protease family)